MGRVSGMGEYEKDPVFFHNLIYFRDCFPRHRQMFEDGNTINNIERILREVVGKSVNIANDIDIRARIDIEAHVFRVRIEKFPMGDIPRTELQNSGAGHGVRSCDE